MIWRLRSILFYSWHGNLIKEGRYQFLVLVNDLTRYVVVVFGLKAKDLKRLDAIIPEAIRETLRQEKIKDTVIDLYLEKAGKVFYTKTKDRTSVARMNKSAETMYVLFDMIDGESLIQPQMSVRMNEFMVGNGKNSYLYPHKEMYNHLEELAGEAIFQVGAWELKITLMLENHEVWRKVAVPLSTTFKELHKIIQRTFGWHNSHLHEFYIYPEAENEQTKAFPLDQKPVMHLVMNREAFHDQQDIPTMMEGGIRIDEYMPARILYVYDFGDDWKHDIQIVRKIEDYKKNYAVCLDGTGKRPPEDVGGEPGYEYFLTVIGDPSHPDYKNMKEWEKHQQSREFDKEKINLRLRN
ncbi:plasmid pRiA4b ORF-3 family protein [Bacillus coahuilensis]|uniref:plasmid pRiA4b ORF-3 family protein n=1 Tax=Bacillus coahuilensis TaxID=408580 RepID=UPI001ED901F7|nr:plasmid pRiA4b ORF-3 family protein [Bacillus coahuilensis]